MFQFQVKTNNIRENITLEEYIWGTSYNEGFWSLKNKKRSCHCCGCKALPGGCSAWECPQPEATRPMRGLQRGLAPWWVGKGGWAVLSWWTSALNTELGWTCEGVGRERLWPWRVLHIRGWLGGCVCLAGASIDRWWMVGGKDQWCSRMDGGRLGLRVVEASPERGYWSRCQWSAPSSE